MKTSTLAVLLLVVIACSGATDPNPKQAVDGGATTSSSSSSGDVASGKPDAGPKGGPSVTPGKIACGTTTCTAPSVCCADTGECKASADECAKEVIACDEAADCAQGRCCAEESSATPMKFSTYCRPTCITNLPRVQVCVSNDECGTDGTGECKDYSCGGFDMKGVKTCKPINTCP